MRIATQDGKPRVFIGSSSEGLSVAEVIQLGLDHVAECTLWNQSTFGLSGTTFESIVDVSAEYDFAIAVLTPYDTLTKRGQEAATPRDNMLFELGLFTGTLGRARTFMVYPRDQQLHLPSDLAGVTAATYATRRNGNLEAALGPGFRAFMGKDIHRSIVNRKARRFDARLIPAP